MDELIINSHLNKRRNMIIAVGIMLFFLLVLCVFARVFTVGVSANPVLPNGSEVVTPEETPNSAVLPNGKDFNAFLLSADKDNLTGESLGKIVTITFDFYTAENEYEVENENVIDGLDAKKVTNLIDLYVANNDGLLDLYILSEKPIILDVDSSSMFKNLKNLTAINFNNFDTSKTENISHMFENCQSLKKLDLSTFNTENVTDMSYMFKNGQVRNIDLTSFNTEKVTTMQSMFENSGSYEIDISSFETDSLNKVENMFYMCEVFTIFATDSFKAPNGSTSMFRFTGNLVGELGTTYSQDNYLSNMARVDKLGKPGYFISPEEKYDAIPYGFELRDEIGATDNEIYSITFDYYTGKDSYVVNGVNVINGLQGKEIGKGIFLYRALNDQGLEDVYILSNDKIYAARGMSQAFAKLSYLGNSKNLEKLAVFNFNNLDTSKCVNFFNMFADLKNVKSLDLSSFDTHQVVTMAFMFSGCTNLNDLDISSFNTERVIDMTQMFGYNKFTELDLSHFSTQKVLYFDNMFFSCTSLRKLNIKHFDTSSAIWMNGMFSKCLNLRELDLSSFELTSIKNNSIRNMFADCRALKTIYVSEKWSNSAISADTSLFINCNSLVGEKGTAYSKNKLGADYAKIDDGAGYFTYKPACQCDNCQCD